MGYYIDQTGNYYEGDRIDWRDTEVSRRPDYTHKWENDEWVLDPGLVPRITLLTMRQARLQMLAMGVLSQVEAAVSQAGDAAQIEWEYAMTVERDYPLFLAIKGMLGFTDEQEETFFNEGSLL